MFDPLAKSEPPNALNPIATRFEGEYQMLYFTRSNKVGEVGVGLYLISQLRSKLTPIYTIQPILQGDSDFLTCTHAALVRLKMCI